MLKYFNNNELSERLHVNLAKWKRWSREFLPPDPLGGLQSGYARQYHPDQAFTVCLGGHLVAELKFSIPEARKILTDLQPWLKNTGFIFLAKGTSVTDTRSVVKSYVIAIENNRNTGFRYTVRGVISKETITHGDVPVVVERYTETIITADRRYAKAPAPAVSAKVLDISRFLTEFTTALELDPVHYAVLFKGP